jgi:hypothetical protein
MPDQPGLRSSIYASHIAEMTGMCHHTQIFIGWDGGFMNTPIPRTVILLISTSQLARITGVSHYAPT